MLISLNDFCRELMLLKGPAGPFNNINSLQKSFNDISILEFENIEIIKND